MCDSIDCPSVPPQVAAHRSAVARSNDDVPASSIIRKEEWYEEKLLVLVMGASGDLAKNKTFPALYELWKAKLLPNKTIIHGYARSKLNNTGLRSLIRPHLAKHATARSNDSDESDIDSFLAICFYDHGTSYGDSTALSTILQTHSFRNLLVYMAVPPHVFREASFAIKTSLSIFGSVDDKNGFVRIVLEKPFGRNYGSCKEMLDGFSTQGWMEDQLFRIDHYLGKEMVQNILSLRRRNAWLKNIWSKDAIQSVHLIWKESIGTEGRGGYFDDYGIIRDVIQNHLLQLLVLVAMELPDQTSGQDIHAAKVAVLQRMRPILLEDILLGQYTGYTDDPTITNKNTSTPTYAAMQCWVDSETWKGVPFVFEAGKALDESLCEIRLNLVGSSSSALVLRIQPRPAVYFASYVSNDTVSSTTSINTQVSTLDGRDSLVKGDYSRLLLQVLQGRHENFVQDDELLLAWKIFTPVLAQIENGRCQPERYGKGTVGPISRKKFLDKLKVGRQWNPPRSAL